MKNILKTGLFLFCAGVMLFSCKEEELGPSQIIDGNPPANAFDQWLYANYTQPYNIDFQYKLRDIETNLDFDVAPADIDKSIAMAKLVKFLWLETMAEVGGQDFAKAYAPKSILLVGSGLYRTTSYIVGYAEGGLKIAFSDVNSMDLDNITMDYLSSRYLKTAFHENAHILHQTKQYTADFANLTATTYMGDDWPVAYSLDSAYRLGYVSNYASSEPNEDFAEIFAIYVTGGQENWDNILERASQFNGGSPASGRSIIEQKLEIVRNYMMGQWNIDMDELRGVFEARGARLDELDLENL